jgi:hypothetical protein
MSSNKLRIIRDFDKMTPEQQKEIEAMYPMGYGPHLITFDHPRGGRIQALPYETEDTIFMVKVIVIDPDKGKDLDDELPLPVTDVDDAESDDDDEPGKPASDDDDDDDYGSSNRYARRPKRYDDNDTDY